MRKFPLKGLHLLICRRVPENAKASFFFTEPLMKVGIRNFSANLAELVRVHEHGVGRVALAQREGSLLVFEVLDLIVTRVRALHV